MKGCATAHPRSKVSKLLKAHNLNGALTTNKGSIALFFKGTLKKH